MIFLDIGFCTSVDTVEDELKCPLLFETEGVFSMMREGTLSMEEADRAVVMGQVAEKRLRQREAAERLGVSVRQVKLLLARYRERGPGGLVSGHRGKASNNALV